MGRLSTSMLVGLCLAGGLMAPSQAWADDDDPDIGPSLTRALQCPMELARMELYPFQIEKVPLDQIPGLSLSLREDEGWPEAVINKYEALQQDLPVGKSSSVFVQIFTAKNPKTLRAAFDYDHEHARSAASRLEAGHTGFLVSDNADDYQDHPSWFVRTRTELPSDEILCAMTERATRDVLVEHGGKTYLVQIWGYYDWDYSLSDTDDPDDVVADQVADHVAEGLDIEAKR